jgi:hypothetical protein
MEVKDCGASPVLPAVRADDIGRPLVPEAALPGRATDLGPARQSACALRVVLAKRSSRAVRNWSTISISSLALFSDNKSPKW